MNDNIPKLEDISPTKCLNSDEKSAVEHFLGLDTSGAERFFEERVLEGIGDLMWMGTPAFDFYIHPFKNVLVSGKFDGELDVMNFFKGTVKFRMDFEALSNEGKKAVVSCIEYWESTVRDVENADLEIYGDLLGELTKIKEMLTR